MRLARLVAKVSALCLMTGFIVYGSIMVLPKLAGSSPQMLFPAAKKTDGPRLLYSIGGVDGPTRPNSVTVDERGRVYITDAGTAKVFVYSKRGRKISEFGGSGAGNSYFGFPNGIVIGKDGNLIITDSVKNDIRIFSPEGKYIRTILKPVDNIRPGYIAKGHDGLLYVSDLQNHKVIIINENGRKIGDLAGGQKPLSYPQSTAMDSQGRLWIADSGNYLIRIFNKKGVEQDLISGGGKPETPFSMVRGIAIDKTGRVFIADTTSGQIRVFNAHGKQVFVFPSLRSPENPLVFPNNLFIDENNKLYVVDRGAGDVKVYDIEK